MSGGRLARRLIIFYAIIAVVGVAVVIFVVDKGAQREGSAVDRRRLHPRRGQPVHRTGAEAGGRHSAAADGADPGAGVGPVVQPPSVRTVRQLHQQPEHARRPASAQREDAPRKLPSPDRHGELRLRRVAEARRRRRLPAPRRRSPEPSAALPFAASFSSAPPAPGAAAPRTPTQLQGTYALSPASTCFGSSFSIHGTGSVAQLYSSSDKLLGPLTYSSKTGRRVRRRQVRQGRSRPA